MARPLKFIIFQIMLLWLLKVHQNRYSNFKEQGYVVATNFFNNREVFAMLHELERFKTENLLTNIVTKNDGKTYSGKAQNLHIKSLNEISELIHACASFYFSATFSFPCGFYFVTIRLIV